MSGKPLPVPGILQQKKPHRCISASLLAEWLKATEQGHQQVMQSLLLNQRFYAALTM
ncbi:DNA invertase [Escherichia coli]|nr:DNA invertase [Escherichia coli]EFC1638143.1 DNA invertase [Escherichia coli]MCH7170804.1 DNA invertase [Escherichia coli]OJQ91819.1 DNA invertase [Escherichia coli]